MKQIDRGFEVQAKREKALGGWLSVYFYAMRLSDNYMLIDDFTTALDPVREIFAGIKGRVDEAIETRGESECVEPGKWGDWTEPAKKSRGKAS